MKTIKKASLLFASLALVLGAGLVGNSDTKEVKAAADVYKKVTDVSEIENDGKYLIVYETDSSIFDGSLTKLDAVKNVKSVTIVNNEITDETGTISKCYFTISESSTSSNTSKKYTIKSASNYYIGGKAKSNALQSSTTTSYDNTISFNNGNVVFTSNSTYLRFNSNLDQKRFRYYKTANSQKDIQLYKLNQKVIVNDAQTIIDLINAIGTVEYTDECKAKIDAARSAYDNAPDLQSKVTNYSVLTAAEARYAELKEEADMEVAIGVEDKIDALPAINDINDNSKVDDIYSVNDEYQKLTDDQKVFVGKDKLTKLEGLLEKLKEYPLSVEQAIAKANQTGTTATNYEYYIKGIVCKYDKTSTGKNKNFDTFKNLTFEISDDGTNSNTFMAYQANYLNKQQFESMDQIALGDIVVICGKILNYNNNTPETTGQGTAYVYSHTSAVSTFVAKVKSFDLCNASTEELKAMLDEYDALIAKNADAANSVVDETTTLAERMAYMQLVYNKKANTTGESTSGVVITSNNSYDKTSLIALFAILGIVTISGYYIIEKKKFSK